MNQEKIIIHRNEIYNKFIGYNFRDKMQSFYHYCAQMLNRTQRMFEYTGLPETIPAEYFERYLQVYGFAVVAPVNDNLYAFVGGLGGSADSPYYEPTFCNVSNPALNYSATLALNEQCAFIRNDIALEGIAPIIARYASAMVENDISMDKVTKNMRANVMINAPNDDLEKAARKFLEDIDNGVNGIVGGFNFLKDITVFPMSGTGATRITDLIEYQQYLKAGLYNELGLQANFNMKRESLNTAETGMNDDILIPLIDEMLIERKKGVDQINKMYGTKITVKLSGIWEITHDEITDPEQGEKDNEPKDSESDIQRMETE